MKFLKNKFITYGAICIFLIINIVYSYYGVSYVVGKSMENTLVESDLLIFEKKYEIEHIKRGDLVILDINYLGEETRIVKRIVGLPSDKISFLNNDLYINEEKVSENYLKEKMVTEDNVFYLNEDEIFIMGDNRNISLDSRHEEVGILKFDESVKGKIICKLSDLKILNKIIN